MAPSSIPRHHIESCSKTSLCSPYGRIEGPQLACLGSTRQFLKQARTARADLHVMAPRFIFEYGSDMLLSTRIYHGGQDMDTGR